MSAEENFDAWAAARKLGTEGTAEKGPEALRVAELQAQPDAEGWLSAADWESVSGVPFLYLHGKGGKPQAGTALKLATWRGWLFARVVCLDPDAAHLVYASTGRDSTHLWRDDCVEIFLRAGEDGGGPLLQFIVNPAGAWFDARDGSDAWDPGTRVRVQPADAGWTVELAVPLADLCGAGRPEAVWRANVSRSRKGREGAFSEETAWRATGLNNKANVPGKFGHLYVEALRNRAAAPAPESLPLPGLGDLLPPERMALALAGKFGVPALALPLAEQAPDLGRGLDDPAWARAVPVDLEPLRNVAGRTVPATQAKILRLADRLLVAVHCAESGGIEAQARPNGADIWKDDGIEVYLAPERKESAGYRHVIVNAAGSVYTGRGRTAEAAPGVEARVFKAAGAWSAVISVPHAAAGVSAETMPALWGCNIIRNRAQRAGEPAQTLVWSSPGAWSFHDPGRFGCLWLPGAPRTQPPGSREQLEAWAQQAAPRARPVAAADWNVFTAGEKEELKLTGMVSRSLKRQLDAQYLELDRKLYGAADWDAWLKHRAAFQQAFRDAIGLPAGKTPLNPRVSVVAENAELRVERLVFESLPGFYVTANCFVPKLRQGKKVPAVVRLIGHSTAGRLGAPLAFGEDLARKGYFALVMDSLGQGERIYHNNGFGSRTPTSNHYGLGAACVLTGTNLAGYMVHDVVRALDYLETREEVDAARLVLTGESGGGTMTSYVAALDDRLAAAAPVSALGPYREGGGNYDSEQVLYDHVRGGFESEGRCAVMAPRPMIVIREVAGDDADGAAWCERIRKVYAMQDASGRFEYQPTREPHGYGKGHARIFHEWLARTVPPNPDAVRAAEPLKYGRDECRAATGASVDFSPEFAGAETVFSLNSRHAARPRGLAARPFERAEAPRRLEDWRRTLRKLLALPEGACAPVRAETRAKLEHQGFPAERLVIETAPGVLVPAILLLPARRAARAPAAMLLSERGKQTLLTEAWPEVRALLEGGVAVFAPDLRGIGETAADDDLTYMGDETSLNGYSYRIGTPLLGLRVCDVLCCAAYLRGREDLDPARLGIAGLSLAAPNPRAIRQPRLSTDVGLEPLTQGESLGPAVALLAFALDEKFAAGGTCGALASYADACRAYFMHPQGCFVPGILRHFDAAEICAAAAPRPLGLFGSVTARNQELLAADEGARDLERARAVYAELQGSLELKHQGRRAELFDFLRKTLVK